MKWRKRQKEKGKTTSDNYLQVRALTPIESLEVLRLWFWKLIAVD